ncbi:MAG: hypothetical protein IPG04_10425 [Polyangiaceae bacterium]|nr:hypothetical protein [Polyangiaceae bacterium]
MIERDKRGRTITLPLSGAAFAVPDNVFVIGTMNTADRSIALLDAALRRRFGFVELLPDTSLFRGIKIDKIPLEAWLDALNEKILAHAGRDARNLRVGHAYFMQGAAPIRELGRFAEILRDDVIPLLEEVCYEDFDALERILGAASCSGPRSASTLSCSSRSATTPCRTRSSRRSRASSPPRRRQRQTSRRRPNQPTKTRTTRVPEVRLREWSTEEPNDGSVLLGLRLDGAAERRAAADLARAGRLTIEELAAGLRVRTSSFVGRVQLGSLTVTIEPKLAKDALLTLVRYAYGLRDVVRDGTTSFATSGALLPDLLAAQLLGEVGELVARGLPRRYVERAEELSLPRGRIDVGALARRAAPATTLPCRHHPRSADHPVIQALRAGLGLAAEIATDGDLRVALRRLAARLGVEVQSVPLTRARLMRAQRGLTRLEATAAPALELIGLLLDGQAVTLDDETTVRLPGFLFDMNRFFQALVGRFLRQHLPGCQVVDERALTGLLRYAPDANPRGAARARTSPRLRGDREAPQAGAARREVPRPLAEGPAARDALPARDVRHERRGGRRRGHPVSDRG